MCQIYDYPKAEDLLVMESALDIFLQSRHGAVRDVMVSVLKVMLERYNVSKICLRWCIVCHGQQGGVQILPRKPPGERSALAVARRFTRRCCTVGRFLS